MIDIEDQTAYSFQYVDCDGKVRTAEFNNPGPTWMECLDDFVSFLESVYKYDIRSKVRIKEPVWLSTMYEHYPDYLDPWTGEYFTEEEEKEETMYEPSRHFSWDE